MTRLYFHEFSPYEDGFMACVGLPMETDPDQPPELPTEMPLNIFIDNYTEIPPNLPECICYIEIEGVGSGHKVFPSVEAYEADHDHTKMASRALIPVGTFPVDSNRDTWTPSPHILFTGIVKQYRENPLDDDGRPNYMLLIETLDMEFTLYTRYAGEIREGYVLQGGAWLFGNMAGADPLPGGEPIPGGEAAE